jgi:hypothetical protein
MDRIPNILRRTFHDDLSEEMQPQIEERSELYTCQGM